MQARFPIVAFCVSLAFAAQASPGGLIIVPTFDSSITTDPNAAAIEETVSTFGQLDVLVNNAGTAIPKTFEETTLEEMDRVIDINVRGTVRARKQGHRGALLIRVDQRSLCP